MHCEKRKKNKREGSEAREGMASFLRECARRLDEGEAAQSVLCDMRIRYRTVRTLVVKTCLVRQLCTPRDEFLAARLAALVCEDDSSRAALENVIDRNLTRDRVHGATLRALPRRFPPNVYALRVTDEEMRECKRLNATGASRKNRRRIRVDGYRMVSHARAIVDAPASASRNELILSLLLLTGRRTCELFKATLSAVDAPHQARFEGQAKKRKKESHGYTIPLLHDASRIQEALSHLRTSRCGESDAAMSNDALSRKYQSALSRHMVRSEVWGPCLRVHGLRGVYACIALRLFDWECSDHFAAMSMLGHVRLEDSLVYTLYDIGRGLPAPTVPSLGAAPPVIEVEDH